MATTIKAPSPAPVPRPVGVAVTKTAATSTAPVSRLGTIKRERLKLGLRFLMYGPPGVGKTTLAADAGALFLDVEGGAGEVEVPRYPFNPGAPDEFRPRDYGQVCDAIEDLIANPGHGFAAVALDGIGALEALIWKHLCAQHKVGSIEKVGGGFGKGYRAATEELRRFLSRLDVLRGTGVQLILIGHAAVVSFHNPEGEDYDRYQLQAYKEFAGQLTEWSDVVGFVHFESGSKKIEGDESRSKRARGWTTNRRLIQLARSAAWDAKCRLSMPDEIEIESIHPWAPFALATMGARNADTRSLTEAALAELDRIGVDEFTTAAGTATSRQAVLDMIAKSDVTTLSRIVAGLQATSSPTASQES